MHSGSFVMRRRFPISSCERRLASRAASRSAPELILRVVSARPSEIIDLKPPPALRPRPPAPPQRPSAPNPPSSILH
eukprot:7215466-Pyramimonas_sp.AAC.1